MQQTHLAWCFLCRRTSFTLKDLPYIIFIRTFAHKLHKNKKDMGLGSYWVRKDDQTGEAKTIKPWEEEVSNGDKFFPDPNGEKEDSSSPKG